VSDRLHSEVTTLGSVSPARVWDALRQRGIWLDLGAATVRLRSDCESLVKPLCLAYRHFPFSSQPQWADLHADLWRVRGPRRWFRPQVSFHCDGGSPFEPFPADTAFPLFEWGVNWLIGRRLNHLLLFHAGVVERHGRALVLPATPGSGKSTLTAALSLRGWRMLSDEFGVLDMASGLLLPMLKPTALKNESIPVIRSFEPDAPIGPAFPKTRKGTVAHLAPSAHAVQGVQRGAGVGAVVLPKWVAGSPTRMEPLQPHVAFSALAFNAFNYTVAGRDGFQATADIAANVPAWQLVYSDLDDALRTLDERWTEEGRLT
jgi:HprK-related kinase A